MVPGVYGAAHRLEAFMLKWRYEVMTVRRRSEDVSHGTPL
jgi:hypothetical protein